MSDYTIRAATDVPDIFDGQYPGAMRFLTEHLDARQIALTHRLMPPDGEEASTGPRMLGGQDGDDLIAGDGEGLETSGGLLPDRPCDPSSVPARAPTRPHSKSRPQSRFARRRDSRPSGRSLHRAA